MSFIFRRFFSSTTSTMSDAATQKAKQLINDNAVGM